MALPTLHTPRDLGEALSLLDKSENSMVYGGGTAIQILAQQGILHAEDLVDIAGVPEMDRLDIDGDLLTVGPLVSIRAMELDPRIAEHARILPQTYGRVANPRVRNTASIGGNIAHGDYRLDPPVALLILRAIVELSSVNGTRQVPVREFFLDFQETAIVHGEMISGIGIPRPPAGSQSTYVKLCSQSANDWPAASVGALIYAEQDRTYLRLALAALASVPLFADLEITGLTCDEAVALGISELDELMEPIPDVRGSADYKLALGRSAGRDAISQTWRAHNDNRA